MNSGKHSQGARIFARLKAKIASAPELEQAALRVVISGAVLLYVAWHAARDGVATDGAQALILVAAFFVFACVTAILLVWAPGFVRAERILGIIADIVAITYAMTALGAGGAVLISAYLFVTIGNGFRYGRSYMSFSQVLSLLGFSFVMIEDPFWSRNMSVGMGFLVTLLIIPIYIGTLSKRIKEANRQAKDALPAKVGESQ